MKYAAILSTLTQEPLVITPSSHASILKLFESHMNGRSERNGVDICGDAVELEQAFMEDGIMHIPINGPIGRGLGKFEKGAGAIDVGDISDELDKAKSDPGCRAVILHIDSPGGMYSGIPELANEIMEFDKPIYAFIPGAACSAAYWLACACDMVCATTSADIGNIGVYCYLIDNSRQYKDAGLDPELITSGQYKGMGAPGIPLTDIQRQHLQDRVDEMAETFYSAVETARPGVSREDMQGQCFKAPSALEKGMVDEIVGEIDDVVAMLS